MLVYIIKSGQIIANIPQGQPYDYLDDRPLSFIIADEYLDNWKDYKVVDGELVKLTEQELNDIYLYGKILTDEERESLIPEEQLPTTIELQERIKELENAMDVMLGVDIDGI